MISSLREIMFVKTKEIRPKSPTEIILFIRWG